MSLRIAQHIYQRLTDREDLMQLTEGRIDPVRVDGDKWPAIIFDTQTGEPDYTKDGVASDTHTVTVYCMARQYMTELLPMAEAVREALELQEAEYEGFEVTECTMLGAEDDWNDALGVYQYTLMFSMTSE